MQVVVTSSKGRSSFPTNAKSFSSVASIMTVDMRNVMLIFRNPRTLEYEITQNGVDKRYILSIKNAKGSVLFSTGPEATSISEAVELLKTILTRALNRVRVEFKDKESLSSQIYNRDGEASSNVWFLSPEVIVEVVEKVRKNYVQFNDQMVM